MPACQLGMDTYVTLSRQCVITADLARGAVRVGCTRRLLADFRDEESELVDVPYA